MCMAHVAMQWIEAICILCLYWFLFHYEYSIVMAMWCRTVYDIFKWMWQNAKHKQIRIWHKKQRVYSEYSCKCFFLLFYDYFTGTLIGSNEAKPISLHQGTMVACCANDLVNKNRVIKRRAGFIATASLWQLSSVTECGK